MIASQITNCIEACDASRAAGARRTPSHRRQSRCELSQPRPTPPEPTGAHKALGPRV